MTQRQQNILNAIVEQYAEVASPVGSSLLAKVFNVSSATIRAEMAELAAETANERATLAGGSATAHGTSGATTPYYSLTLKSVQTLAGPAVTSGSIAWVAEAGPLGPDRRGDPRASQAGQAGQVGQVGQAD